MGKNKTGRTTDMLKKAYEHAIIGNLSIVVGIDIFHARQLCRRFVELYPTAGMEVFPSRINIGKGRVQFLGVEASLSGYGKHTLFRDHSVPESD